MTNDSTRLPGAPWIWFDLDDTLWNFTANSLTALSELYRRHELLQRLWGSLQRWLDSYHAINAALWQKYNRGEIDTDTLRTQRFSLALQSAGYSAGDILSTARSLDAEYLYTLSGLPALVDGAEEMLQALHPHYNIGVLSNGFRDTQPRKLQSGRIDGYIDCMVLSDSLGINKPDRRIYDHARALSGGGSGGVVMVGDNPETDIAGALRAGWPAVWYNPDGKPLTTVTDLDGKGHSDDMRRVIAVTSLAQVQDAVGQILSVQ